MSLLLKNAVFIDWETLDFISGNIMVTGDEPSLKFFYDPQKSALPPGTEIIDCSGKLVTKSFAVGHHHAYSALSRGMPAPEQSPQNFHEILKYIWWRLDKCLDAETIESSALVTAMACLKAGSTFLIDHHASPMAVKGSLEIIAKAFEKVGVSHLLCYEVSDRDGEKIARQGIDETEVYLRNHQGLVGLHASFTVSDKTLRQAVALTKIHNSGIHIHVAEDGYDQERCLREHGKRVVGRLRDAGVMNNPKSILVHCLHLDDNERELISSSPLWVAQNSESNLNNNVGHFKSTGLGDNIILGTDGMHSDMLRSAKAAFLDGQQSDGITSELAYRRFRSVHRYLRENNFEGDGDNNLVILDYDTPTPVNRENFLSHFIYGLTAEHVTDVISNGKLVVRDRKILTVDEEEILKESRRQAERLWERMVNLPPV